MSGREAAVVAAPASTSLAARRQPIAGDGLLNPVVLGALVLLVVNDQVLKRVWPGPMTGKLSDVAGLIVAPIVLVAAAELIAAARGRWPEPARRLVSIAVVATALCFAAVKLLPPAEAAWELLIGIAQWPVSAARDALGGLPIPPVRAVLSTPDATDLVALPAVWIAHGIGLARAGPRDPRADATSAIRSPAWWYDLGVAGLSLAMLSGAIVDGWSHVHDPRSLETVLTPAHGIVYVSFALVGVLVWAPLLAARLEGRDPIKAMPVGFGPSVVGVVAFLGVGLADLVWHLAFGLEADTEALISPTHLGLGATAAMIASGPVRAAWLRRDDGTASWSGHLPAILAVVAIAGVAAFAVHPVNLFVDTWPRWPYGRFDATWYAPNLGIAGVVVPTLLVFVPLIELARRWPALPAGVATVVATGVLGGLTFLHDGQALVGAPALGGLLIDALLLVAPPARSGRWPLATLGPVLLFGAYFLVLSRTGTVTWSAHLIGGTIAIAAATGTVVGWLARDPGRSLTTRRSNA